MALEDLRGRVALVTGGSGGIGRALVRRLATAGCHVAVGYAGGAEAAGHAVSEAVTLGVRAVALQADLADPDAARGLADRATAALGPVDVLVPNAGVAIRTHDLEGVDLDVWQRSLAVNLTAPFLLAQRLVPDMAERGFGRVLFVSSVAAFTGGVVGPHYAASKAGLHGLVYWLAGAYAARGVTFNALAPALVTGTAMLPTDPTGAARTPVGRFGTTDETADLAVTMLANGYLTGKTYLLDGGIHPR
jgi:3-oxoacyl-[acyl-carrier protein] reductase